MYHHLTHYVVTWEVDDGISTDYCYSSKNNKSIGYKLIEAWTHGKETEQEIATAADCIGTNSPEWVLKHTSQPVIVI